ncbi:MAG TPA: flavodoxin domain-containing protein [Bacteroidales bacterium]|nr:hypothetical protein [Bacteroidales bacterium]HNR41852.1 flavodoxin domain-containing protein [Bacteroidales bacterium]HPM18188.1 flavodoxin domain-containing protein [Bacteroidales bacterium]
MKKREFIKKGFLGIGSFFLAGKAKGLEYYPMPSDKRIAVIYATWCGTSRDAALWISEGMDGIANVFDVREDPDISGYDHLIIGGSIRQNKVPGQLENFLEKNRAAVSGKVRGLFAVCGNMRQPVGNEQYRTFIQDYLAPLSGAGQVPSRIFLGRITWGLMEPEVCEMMKKIPGMEEYDNLKRPECMAFGREILDAINKVN